MRIKTTDIHMSIPAIVGLGERFNMPTTEYAVGSVGEVVQIIGQSQGRTEVLIRLVRGRVLSVEEKARASGLQRSVSVDQGLKLSASDRFRRGIFEKGEGGTYYPTCELPKFINESELDTVIHSVNDDGGIVSESDDNEAVASIVHSVNGDGSDGVFPTVRISQRSVSKAAHNGVRRHVSHEEITRPCSVHPANPFKVVEGSSFVSHEEFAKVGPKLNVDAKSNSGPLPIPTRPVRKRRSDYAMDYVDDKGGRLVKGD